MPDALKRCVVVSIVDDEFLLATATFEPQGGEYELVELSDIEVTPRAPASINSSLDRLGLAETVGGYIAKGADKVDVFAVSTFGTVGLKDGVVRYVPGSGPERGTASSLDIPSALRIRTQNPHAIVYVDNDASASALGESIAGAGQGLDAFAFVWVGRGVNVGLISHDDIWRGRMHPEAGHSLVRVRPEDTLVAGDCSIHSDCVMGRVSSKSIEQRILNGDGEELVRSIVASYLAQLCMNISLFAAPQAIAIGGPLMTPPDADALIKTINLKFTEYIGLFPSYTDNIDPARFILRASLGPESGVLGMLEVTRRKLTLRESTL